MIQDEAEGPSVMSYDKRDPMLIVCYAGTHSTNPYSRGEGDRARMPKTALPLLSESEDDHCLAPPIKSSSECSACLKRRRAKVECSGSARERDRILSDINGGPEFGGPASGNQTSGRSPHSVNRSLRE